MHSIAGIALSDGESRHIESREMSSAPLHKIRRDSDSEI